MYHSLSLPHIFSLVWKWWFEKIIDVSDNIVLQDSFIFSYLVLHKYKKSYKIILNLWIWSWLFVRSSVTWGNIEEKASKMTREKKNVSDFQSFVWMFQALNWKIYYVCILVFSKQVKYKLKFIWSWKLEK